MYKTKYIIQGCNHTWITTNQITPNDELVINEQEQNKFGTLLQMLSFWSKIASKYNIKWFSICGTALGAKRHSGFIPFDDDIDICVLLKDYKIILKFISSQKRKHFYIEPADVGFRIFSTNGIRYPFLDIWVVDNCKKNNEKLIYACPFKEDLPTYYASTYLDNEYILKCDIDQLDWVNFENTKIPQMKNVDGYLKRAYGNNCLTTYVGEPVKNVHLIIENIPFYEITQLFFKICEFLKLDDQSDIHRHFSCFVIRIMFLIMRDFNRDPVYMYNRISKIFDEYTNNFEKCEKV